MTDPDEEQQKLERDMWRVVWVLLPIAAFIFLLLVIQRRRGHRGLLPCVHRRPQATPRNETPPIALSLSPSLDGDIGDPTAAPAVPLTPTPKGRRGHLLRKRLS